MSHEIFFPCASEDSRSPGHQAYNLVKISARDFRAVCPRHTRGSTPPHRSQAGPTPIRFPVCAPLLWRLERLASGPALAARWGQPADTLPADHPAWSLEARYLALGLVTFICTLAPQRIIMGGGVLHQAQLFPRLRQEVRQVLNDYIQVPELRDQIDDYIVPPALGDQAGVLGALALAHTVWPQ